MWCVFLKLDRVTKAATIVGLCLLMVLAWPDLPIRADRDKTGIGKSQGVGVCLYVNERSMAVCKLQALVYDILPSTTAVFSYAIGSRKLSANGQFFVVGAQTVVIKFVTNNSNKTRRVIYSRQQSLHQHK